MKHLTIAEAMSQIENAPLTAAVSKKISIPTLWPKIRPFVLMLSTIFGFSKKIQSYINAFVAALDAFVASSE